MIPNFVEIDGAPWCVLPPGEHLATMEEINQRFAYNHHRRKLFGGLMRACEALAAAGCRALWLDGSYVTEKPLPSDHDSYWVGTDVNKGILDPVFLDFSNRRAAQKAKYYGEFFIAGTPATEELFFEDFFQKEKATGQPKGIIAIDLSVFPPTIPGGAI